MNWDITESTIDGFFFANIKMDEGTHIVYCKFIDSSDLSAFDINTTDEIVDPQNSEETYVDGDHILIAIASHYGNNSNTTTIPCNRLIDNSGKQVCMVLIHLEDSSYSIKRVKRTSNRVSDAHPIIG